MTTRGPMIKDAFDDVNRCITEFEDLLNNTPGIGFPCSVPIDGTPSTLAYCRQGGRWVINVVNQDGSNKQHLADFGIRDKVNYIPYLPKLYAAIIKQATSLCREAQSVVQAHDAFMKQIETMKEKLWDEATGSRAT